MTSFHLSDTFIERLGWVLLHSVWLFALIALVVMVLERAMRRFSSGTRYGVFLVALGAMTLAPAATWLVMPENSKLPEVPAVSNEIAERQGNVDEPAAPETTPFAQPGTEVGTQLPAAKNPTPPLVPAQPEEQLASPAAPFWKSMEEGVQPWLGYLVIAWCLGVCVFALRPMLSWYRVRRLRTVGVSPPPDAVQQLLERTAQRLHLRQAVRVLQSTLVQTAVVVGYFRPVILLPMSAITGLSTAQLEAILAHELAHIRRHDYLVNLLQTLVETVFLYHPAVWWLSNLVRSERENCCDDIAVAMLGNRVEYGRALLALEENRVAETALTVGAGGGSLLARVRRLFGCVPPGRAFSGGSIAAIGLLAAVAIAVGVWAANGLGEADAEALAKEPDQVKKEGVIVKAPGSHTLDVALSPDGKILARAGTGKTELWDVASGKQLHTLKGQPHFYKAAFSPDGKSLASIGGDVEPGKYEVAVKLWDVATGKERVLGKGQPIRAFSMAFSPDSKTLATSYPDPAAVKLWDVATGKEKMELGGAWGSLAFSPDGKTLAIGDSSVHLWDLTTGKKRVSLARKEDWSDVRPFAYSDVLGFSPDGKTLVSAGLHKAKDDPKTLHAQLTVWDVATAKERASIAIPGYSVPNAPPFVFTADGKTLITAVWIFGDLEWIHNPDENTNGRVSVQHWDLATGKSRAMFWTPVNPGGNHPDAGHVVGFYFAGLSADGKTVAWGGAEGNEEEKITGTAHIWEVQSLATSPPKIPKELQEAREAKKAEKKDIEDLKGTWKLRAVETGGRRQDPKHLQTQMRIDPAVLTLDIPEDHKYPWANYRIDVCRRPKRIDMVFTAKSSSPLERTYISVKAIYLLDGDRLTICRGRERTLPKDVVGSSIATDPRPTEFKTQPGDGLTLEIYERVTEREQRAAEREKAEGTFSLQMPAQAIFVKPGERKTVTLGIRRGKRFEEDVTLTFTDVPNGVTLEPAKPVSKHPSTEVEFTIQAAKEAALGDFAIKVTGGAANGHARENQLELSVDPAGEAARERSGKPPRRYLRPSRDPFMFEINEEGNPVATGGFDFSMGADETAHDGEILSVAGGKLTMKSKDGTEHSYTLADKPQITYQNATCKLEALKAGMIVRVTANKAKPQEATRIEAVYAYGAFMAEYEERERQKKEQQEIERRKQEVERQKKVQQDIDHLQGTWLVVSSQTGDKKEPLESLKKQRVIIKGDHLTLAFGNERNEKREGTIKIDPQKKSLDWVIPKAGDAARKAIYELKGDDLKIGFGVDGLLRPTCFEMGKDQVGWLLVLKRAPR